MSRSLMIALRSDEKQVEAFETSNPDIYIHPMAFRDGGVAVQFGLWTVSHRPTGRAIFLWLPNRETAEMAADWLSKQPIDWSQSYEELNATVSEEFKESRKAIEYALREFKSAFELLAGALFGDEDEV